MLTAAALRLLQEKGLTLDDIIQIAEANEEAVAPARTARQDRNARYYARKRLIKTSEASELRRFPSSPEEMSPTPPKTQTPPTLKENPPKGGQKKVALLPDQAEEFEETFWPIYPHKVGKGAARQAFVTARKKVSLETIVAGVQDYRHSKPPDRDWCNPATWLNQERWTDQPANIHPAERNLSNAERTREALKQTFLKHFVEPNGSAGYRPHGVPGSPAIGYHDDPNRPSHQRRGS